jgi:hypothetical protein
MTTRSVLEENTIVQKYISGQRKPHLFSPGTVDPLKGHGDISWTAPWFDDSTREERVVGRIQGQYSLHVAKIKALKLAQPSVVWSKRVIKVLILATIGLGVAAGIVGAKLFLPLIIVGSLLAISLLLYINMRGNISNEAKELARRHQQECTSLAWTDVEKAGKRYDAYRENPLPSKPKKESTTAKEYADAYNEFVAQQLLWTGHSCRNF